MFCSNCGNDMGNANFCSACGAPANNNNNNVNIGNATGNTQTKQSTIQEIVLWEGKPAGLIDKAKGKVHEKLIDTYYKVTNYRIIVSGGLIGKSETEVEMKDIKDIKVNQSLPQRATGVGSIVIYSTDLTEGIFELKNVPDVINVKEIIRKAYLEARSNMNILYKENI